MSSEQSLADLLVQFMRSQDQSAEKVEALPESRSSEASVLLAMLETSERSLRDSLRQAAIAAQRIGQLADSASNGNKP